MMPCPRQAPHWLKHPAMRFLDQLLESAQKIDELRASPSSTKEEVLDAWEMRLSAITGALVAAPSSTSFCIWRRDDLQDDEHLRLI